MSEFEVAEVNHIRILVIADPDINSASMLGEKYVPHQPHYDACIVCGSFVSDAEADEVTRSPESSASTQGNISSIIAQLENIVCRVVYLPGENDPSEIIVNQLHLTPNSVNIHGRTLPLGPGVQICGFSEPVDTVPQEERGTRPEITDADDVENEFEIEGSQSIDIIHEILDNSTSSSTILVLNHRYLHTLNALLFHSDEVIERSGLKLCIVAASLEAADRLPQRLGLVTFVTPRSLRKHGGYASVDLTLDKETGLWQPVVEYLNL